MTKATGPKYPEVRVQLSGEDGNAFAILGRVQGALRTHLKATGMPHASVDAEIAALQDETLNAQSYGDLLGTVGRWVAVQ